MPESLWRAPCGSVEPLLLNYRTPTKRPEQLVVWHLCDPRHGKSTTLARIPRLFWARCSLLTVAADVPYRSVLPQSSLDATMLHATVRNVVGQQTAHFLKMSSEVQVKQVSTETLWLKQACYRTKSHQNETLTLNITPTRRIRQKSDFVLVGRSLLAVAVPVRAPVRQLLLLNLKIPSPLSSDTIILMSVTLVCLRG